MASRIGVQTCNVTYTCRDDIEVSSDEMASRVGVQTCNVMTLRCRVMKWRHVSVYRHVM